MIDPIVDEGLPIVDGGILVVNLTLEPPEVVWRPAARTTDFTPPPRVQEWRPQPGDIG